MAQVRAIRKCFIDNALREEGSVFEYEGPNNTNIEFLSGAPVGEVKAAPTAAAEAKAPTKKWKSKASSGAEATDESQA